MSTKIIPGKDNVHIELNEKAVAFIRAGLIARGIIHKDSPEYKRMIVDSMGTLISSNPWDGSMFELRLFEDGKNSAAVALGKITSKKKAKSSVANGAKGGRPASFTEALHLVPTGKYMHVNTGSVDTGKGWEADYQAAVKSGLEDSCWNGPEDAQSLCRVRKSRTMEEKAEHGEWMPY